MINVYKNANKERKQYKVKNVTRGTTKNGGSYTKFRISDNKLNQETRQWELVHHAEHRGTYQRDNLFVNFTEEFVSVGLRSTNKMGIVY